MYRNTYVNIYLKNIENNVKKIIQNNPGYSFYFGVVKADAYGHGLSIIPSLLKAGVNYLAVATLEEALEIRNLEKEVPILILGYVHPSYVDLCMENNLTITVPSLEYAKEIVPFKGRCHIKLNTGMNRLGISSKEEYEECYRLLKVQVEGVYTHIYHASNEEETNLQLDKMEHMIENTKDIPIIHVRASEATIRYQKRDFENGCRLGIIMYNLVDNAYGLSDTIQLVSEIIQIHELQPGEKIGYDGSYTATSPTRIGVVSIGYADGVNRKNEGRFVYIHDKQYPIVGHICMDMLFVKIDDTVKEHDEVYLLKDSNHIKEVASYLGTIPYEVVTSIGKRVPRISK